VTDLKLTELQQKITEFWHIRGHEKIMHLFGELISLHRKDECESLGISLQYLEQFYEMAYESGFDDGLESEMQSE